MSSAELYINLANICSNWNALNSLSNGVAGAVVKANAYGLGIKEVGISLATSTPLRIANLAAVNVFIFVI